MSMEEEEETRDFEEIPVEDLVSGSDKAIIGSDEVVSQGVDPVIKVMEESKFDSASLKDEQEAIRQPLRVKVRPMGGQNAAQSKALGTNYSSSPFFSPAHAILKSSTNARVDPGIYSGGGYSQFSASPQSAKPKAVMPNLSPEMLHLVDSAIMGKAESLDKLKNIVSGSESLEHGDEMDGIAFLIVDSLLASMGGVESFEDDDNNKPPRKMISSRAAIVAADLIPSLPWVGDSDFFMSPRTRMVRGLLILLRACTQNRSMCSLAGLLGVLLGTAEKIFIQDVGSVEQMGWDGTPLCYCIQYLAGHSLSVNDLRRWLHVITRTFTTEWATHLMLALERAVCGRESRGPACTFEFDGESSGLLGPGESNWPFSNGYSFVTWIYIESFADPVNAATVAAAIATAAANSGESSSASAAAAASALAGEGSADMPRLFSFVAADNQGVEAFFHAQFLVVEIISGKGKKASMHFTHAFKPQCWYFIGLEHTCKQGLLGKAESELRLYIDGSLYESRPFEFPGISKPLSFCCIGTNPPPKVTGSQPRRLQYPLFAEMGPVYIFKESIGPERMAKLAARGGDVLPSFGHGAGLPWLSTNERVQTMTEETALLDADIEGSIHLLYHPSLLSGRSCQDASPSGPTGTLRRPAEVLGQLRVATRMQPVETFWALAYGGPLSLLPLAVTHVNKDSLEPEQGSLPLSLATAVLAAPIFRIISIAIQNPRNNEELCRARGPELLSRILNHLLLNLSSLDVGTHEGVDDEELVAAVVSLCQSEKKNHSLKVHLFRMLLLDLKIWSLCSYGLQKKLLSSLADMVFTESLAVRDANAIQMLLDGCRKCYWTIREKDSMNSFCLKNATRPVGEVNALVDELLVVIELLVGSAPPSFAATDVHCLLAFMVDCPQHGQVARMLHLIHRLVIQPNTSRAQTFVDAFLAGGGLETLLVLLQREARGGNSIQKSTAKSDLNKSVLKPGLDSGSTGVQKSSYDDSGSLSNEQRKYSERQSFDICSSPFTPSRGCGSPFTPSRGGNIRRTSSVEENLFDRNLGGISFSISADNARNNCYNVEKADGIVVGIIGLLSALVSAGHLKVGSHVSSDITNSLYSSGLSEGGGTMFDDKVSLLLFALQKVFRAAPNRLMTINVHTALLGASVNASSTDDVLNLYHPGRCFEHLELLLVLLRSLPYAPRDLQMRSLQDLLFLACSHPENRRSLTNMEEWPEWILEILISNHETGASKPSKTTSIGDIEDLIHNFLIIMLEHSMRQKDGWKDIEATIHCAEWLSIVGGSSTGDQRVRREEALPIFKRRLLGDLLAFADRELQVQTQVIAAAAAVVAAEGLSPKDSKAEAENAAQLSVFLVENAIVILMLVEDHLRLQSKLVCASHFVEDSASTLSFAAPMSPTSSRAGESIDAFDDRRSGDTGGVPLDVLAAMADANGQISAAVMERLTAAAAAEPYESVSCAFVSYGSCAKDLAEGWKYRSRLWYGVGLPSNIDSIGGGGSGLESWKSILDKDENGNWIELPLVKKSVSMLQALLLDESGLGLGSGLGIAGGFGTGMGGMSALYQLLDSDQPFLCMLRMVLLSMREDENGEGSLLMRASLEDGLPDASPRKAGNVMSVDSSPRFSPRNPHSALLWSVLSPVLNMPVAESKRQRVLAASCVLYSEVWHAVSRDRVPIRKHYLEAILPPFISVLRRWGPLLAGTHELARADGLNPLVADDRALAADSSPIEAALAMISPNWAAAFASPPASMALAMIAAGASGGEASAPVPTKQLKRESSLIVRKKTKLQTFSSLKQPLEANNAGAPPKDKAAAKAAALAAARDLERNSKIGTGRGLSAIAMATSAQRRNGSDMGRVKRWNFSEAMSVAWMECLQPVDTKSVYGKDFNALSYKFIAVLVASFALSRNMQRLEIDRRLHVDIIARHRLSIGVRAWRKLIHCLIDTKCLYGPFKDQFCNSGRVFWKLDVMESSSRMRLLIRKNYEGSDHFASAAKNEHNEDDNVIKHCQEKHISPYNIPILATEAISMATVNEEDEQADIDNLKVSVDETEQNSPVAVESSDDIQHVTDPELVQSLAAVAPGYASSKLHEGIVLELPSSMVRPLKVIPGIFQVTTKRINFIVDNNTAMDGLDFHSGFRKQEKHRSWLMSSLHQIHSRRYLLRKSALELFMIDRSNFFFDFGNTEGRRDAYRAIVQSHPSHLNNIYLTTQRPEHLLKRLKLMERWARWEISNFEYLIHLNTLAGRSYNDITQYPIFPWVLSDYSSNSLNLEDPSSYRDLSKPVGALNPGRLEKFKERYSSFDDTVIPKFHYASHYSSAVTVLYYLIRVEPFTTLYDQLQGGKFDPSDKMFSDIACTWNEVLQDISDVKELVPEMFYLPDILTNGNGINFGTTQLGEKGCVKLPPWAENPVDFIHKHRMALESEHVSANLHQWIDLIFGYKQRGKEAIEANNVFSYITYEGVVDIDKLPDPVQQRAIQDHIAYLGQTPSQLLTVPHLKRMPLMEALHLQTIFGNPKAVKPYSVQYPERCNLPAAAIRASPDTVVVVDGNAPVVRVAVHSWQPNTHDGEGIPFLFQHGKTPASPSDGAFARMFKGSGGAADEWQFPQALAFPAPRIDSSAVVAITRDGEIITGGHVDNSIKLISSDGAKTLETATGHCAPVTCVALSPNSCYLVTGSRDTTVLLWRINRTFTSHPSNMLESSSGNETPTSRRGDTISNILSDKSRNRRFEGPIHVLRGHRKEVLCCCVNSDLGIVVSSSKSSDLLLHSIRKGRLIRRLAGFEAHAISISCNGVVIAWDKLRHTLCTFSLNGVSIARAQLPFSRSVSCMEVSADGKSALIGVNVCKEIEQFDVVGEDKKLDVPAPSICFLDLHTLKVFHVFKLGKEQGIVALTLNKEKTNLLVSTADKKLIIYTDPEGRNLLSRDEQPTTPNWLSGLTSSLIA